MLRLFPFLPGGSVCPCTAAVGCDVCLCSECAVISTLFTVVYLGYPPSLPVCSLPANDVLVEAYFLTFAGVPDSLCYAPLLVIDWQSCGLVSVFSTAAFVASPFVPPEPLEWVDSRVGWTSRICACVLKFGSLARSDACGGAHPKSVSVVSLVPPRSIGLL